MKKKQRLAQRGSQGTAPAADTPLPSPKAGRTDLLLLAGLACLTCVAYLPALAGGLTNWDDHLHITQNADIRSLSLENLRTICTSFYVGMYHPLTTLSFAAEYFFMGLDPRVYHAVNLALHLANVILAYAFFNLLCRRSRIALCVAALFALHPMHVESVAWVTERKDVLYAFFFLASLISYYKYSAMQGGRGYLAASLAFFLCSLFSKSAAVTLPLVLILIDYHASRPPDKRAVLDKAPYFALSLIFGLVGMASQKTAISDISALFTIVDRFFLVCHTILFYAAKLLFPYPLCAIYPYPAKAGGLLPLDYYAAPVLLGMCIFGIVRALRFRQGAFKKDIAFGCIFFLVSLSLVIQIIPVGRQIAADRYTYISSLGLFYIASIGVAELVRRLKVPPAGIAALCGALAVLCAAMACHRAQVWHDSATLWSDTLSKEPRAADAWYGLAIVKRDAGDQRGAAEDFSRAIAVDPYCDTYYYNRAVVLQQLGETDRALADYTNALVLNPRHGRAYVNRGILRQSRGSMQEAVADFDMALELNPQDAKAREAKASALAQAPSGNAAPHSTPSSRQTIEKQFLLAKSLAGQKKYPEALEYLNVALVLNPGSAEVLYYRGTVLNALGREKEGCEDLRKAAEGGYAQAAAARKEHCGEPASERN